MIRQEHKTYEHQEKQQRFMALLAPYHLQLSRFAHALIDDEEDARDLLSETILRAYDRLDTLRDDDAFASYIFTIARRLGFRRTRRSKWQGVFDRAFAERIPDDRGTSPEVHVDTLLLNEALRKLPLKQREAVILFEISGFSLEEIRVIQRGSLSGVKSRVARGRKQLERSLTETSLTSSSREIDTRKGHTLERSRLALINEEKG